MNFKFLVRKFSTRRVVITGMGCVTPLGNSLPESFKNLREYKSGIRDLSGEDYANLLPNNCKIGGTIPKNFEAKKFKTLVKYVN
jgi:3-oxoacyl-[acyl-carrier-protein] synthase II